MAPSSRPTASATVLAVAVVELAGGVLTAGVLGAGERSAVVWSTG
jgi:hypothetical protein